MNNAASARLVTAEVSVISMQSFEQMAGPTLARASMAQR
jgi:hypothetical protein